MRRKFLASNTAPTERRPPQRRMTCEIGLSGKAGNGLIASLHPNWLSPVKVRNFLAGGGCKSILYDDLDASDHLKVYDRGGWTCSPIPQGSALSAHAHLDIDFVRRRPCGLDLKILLLTLRAVVVDGQP